MSSILTNNSAMTALQTLRTINKDLQATQSEISTGKKIASARDNAAIWSVSSVMQSDVAGFKAITDSLALGSSTLSVARSGAETVNDLLTEMKGRIVAAQSDNVDRGKIQADAAELRNNINATVAASQFNGLNMLQGDLTDPEVEILGSLDRGANGGVTVANINVNRFSLEEGDIGDQLVFGAAADNTTATDIAESNIDAAGSYNIGDKIAVTLVEEGTVGITMSYTITADDMNGGTDALGAALTADATADQLKTKVMLAFAQQLADLDTSLNDAAEVDIADEIDTDDATTQTNAQAIIDTAIGNLFTDLDDFDMETAGAAANMQVTGFDGSTNARENTVIAQAAQSGGLAELSMIDVSTKGGAMAALSAIEGMTQSAIDAAASFGSSGKRVDIQMDFLKSLTDNLTVGIGALIDADMEEVSARLQALQVQQQLGVQSLSIANQQPQTLLSLFR